MVKKIKKDKSKINISLEKRTIKNLYEILDHTEKEIKNSIPPSEKMFVKWEAMLDAIPSIRQAIVSKLKSVG